MRGLQIGEGFRDYILGQEGLQVGVSLRDFKLWQKDYKSGQRFQLVAKRFQNGIEITNGGKNDYKPGQGLQIGAEQPQLCLIV